jgi:hypothetical protein
VFGDRHVIVMVSVTEETPYLSGFLAGVTVMTLMTLIYGLILDRGVRRYERGYRGRVGGGDKEIALWRCWRHGARSGRERLRVLQM